MVVLNSAISGLVSAENPAINVVFPSSQEIAISHTDDSIRIGDGTDFADVTAANALKTDSSHVTQPVSAASLPLPTGAATAARQDTGNTSLASIDIKQSALDFRGASQVTFPTADSEFDAFGRMRISNMKVLLDSMFTFNLQPDLWTSSTATGGTITHNANESTAELSVTTSSGSSAVYRTRRYVPYQAGRSQLVTISSVFGSALANCRKRVGYFDASNGIYLEQTSADVRWVIRTSTSGSPSDARFVAQADWNIDKLDGNGRSGLTLDLTKVQLLVIDFAWQAAGQVRVGFNIDGKIVYTHRFTNSNSLTVPYMKQGSLPVRAEITNTAGAASASTLKVICVQVASETGIDPLGVVRTVSNGITMRSLTTTFLPIISIRLKSTALTHSLQIIKSLVFCNTADALQYQVIIGGTLTNASFASVHADSIAEFDVAATAITGGTELNGGYFNAGGAGISIIEDQSIYTAVNSFGGSLEDGTAEIITLTARALAGVATGAGTLVFMEWM